MNMASSSAYSGYLLSLEKDSKDVAARYKDKIRVIQGVDPFTLGTSVSDEKYEEVERFPPVNAFHIVSYLVLTHSFYTNEQMKAYKSLSAYKYFEAGFVQNCQARNIGEHVVVLGQVKHSQRMNEQPLKVWIICQRDGSIISAHCTCMAGQSEVCSHVGAVLYGLEYMHQAAQHLSPTDVKAKWIVPSVSEVPICKVSELEFRRTASSQKASTTSSVVSALEGEELVIFLTQIKESGDQAALMKIVEPFASEISPSEEVQSVLPKLYCLYKEEYELLSYQGLCDLALQINETVDSEVCHQILLATKRQSYTKEWFKQRTGRITASNFKRVCQTSISKPSLSLIKSICYPLKVQFKSKATDWGLQHEEVALTEFQNHMESKHVNFKMEKTGLHISPKYPFLGASPDAMVSCDCCGVVCVEVKCPYMLKNSNVSEYLQKKNSCIEYNPYDKDNIILKPNHPYFYQVQTQIHITNAKYGYFVIWSPKDFFIIKMSADQDFWDNNFPKALEFHKKVVLPELLGRYFTRGKHLNQIWCYCQKVDDGQLMIKCDGEECEIQWFHLQCTELSDVPENLWLCTNCSVETTSLVILRDT